MRNIHPAALIGLLLNLILAYMVFNILPGLDLSGLAPEEREFFEILAQAIEDIKPFSYSMLAAQAAALGMICSGIGLGLGLAAAASFLMMLPVSLIYFLGCAMTHYNVKYAAFARAPAGYAGARFLFPGTNLGKTRLLTISLLLSSLLCLLLGILTGTNTYDMVLVMLGLSLACAYSMARARRQAALGLYDEHLTLSPALFAAPILLPYRELTAADLNDDGSVIFELKKNDGHRQLVWQSNSVIPRQRRRALEELGAALTANGVPLR